MTDHFTGPHPGHSQRQRRAGQVLGSAARALMITAAVVLVAGGLAVAGFMVLLVVGLNSWASNK